VPTPSELGAEGLDLPAGDIERLLNVDCDRWREEMRRRGEHLAQFPDLPEPIRAAHERIAAELG